VRRRLVFDTQHWHATDSTRVRRLEWVNARGSAAVLSRLQMVNEGGGRSGGETIEAPVLNRLRSASLSHLWDDTI
jgi:hypothetical protein